MRKYIILGVLVLMGFLSACANLGLKSSAPEEVNANPKVAHKYEVPQPPKKEPGSLWSEDSRWNTIYQASSGRLVGDTLTVKVNDTLKDRITLAMNQNKKPEPPKVGVDKAQPEGSADTSNAPAAPGTANANAKKDDTAVTEATILEVFPNGSYRVGVNRAFKIGRENPYVVMEGLIKEKEIAPDDSISSDAIKNIKIETFDEQKHTIQSEKKIASESPTAPQTKMATKTETK